MTIKVQNISSSSPCIGLFITFIYDEKLYKIPMSYLEVSIFKPLKLRSYIILKLSFK